MSAADYVLRWNVGDIEGCERCYSEAPTVLIERDHTTLHRNPALPKMERLCKFCAETHLGTILKYDDQHSHDTKILAEGLCQSFNVLYWKAR